ncbi:MAG TPA: hypothetical protein DDW85_09365 [Porphyromonadaceae bacterium]|nr:hypothetical protein [Porphyromonadaceae bacterium]
MLQTSIFLQIAPEDSFFCFIFIQSKKQIMKTIVLSLFFSIFVFSLLNAQNNNVQEIIQQGVELHDAAEYKKAIEKYQEALKIDPKSNQAVYEMSLSYLQLKDYKKASEYSTKVINSNNKELSVGAYAVKSEALAEMDMIDEAIQLLKDGLQRNGDEYLLHFNLALNYYKKRDLDNALTHVKRAIDLDKTHSGAYLLYAYTLNSKKYWVQSIFSFQMFLLLEPDSQRSKNAFEEMLQTMRVKPASEKPVERSFIQQQLMRNQGENNQNASEIPPLSIVDGLNRNFVYSAITHTLDSLTQISENENLYICFKEVNEAILKVLEKENNSSKEGIFWNFYVPFFSYIANSEYYDIYCRYISSSYFPESLAWWKNNPNKARNFIRWFEKGDNPDT